MRDSKKFAELLESPTVAAALFTPEVARQNRANAKAKVEQVKAGLKVDPNDLSADRAVRRAEKKLSESENKVATGQRLIEDAADRDELAVVVEAITATTEDSDAWLNDTLKARVPELAAAIDAERAAAITEAKVVNNDVRLRRAVAEKRALAVPLTE